MYRNTFVEVNLTNLEYNVKTLINRYKNYKYYFTILFFKSIINFFIKFVYVNYCGKILMLVLYY